MNTRQRPQADCHPDRPHVAHGQCQQCWRKARRKRENDLARRIYAADPEAARKRNREKYAKNPQHHRERTRRYFELHPERKKLNRHAAAVRAYGLTVEKYEALLAAQGNGCAICGHVNPSGRRLAIDHDHGSGAVRGLLCFCCNRGLGGFRDDPTLLAAAIQYLRPGVELHPVTWISRRGQP